MKKRLITLSVLMFLFIHITNIQAITLVDFGTSRETTTFGLTGWETVIKSDNILYTSQGNGGVIITGECEEFDEYRGVSGTARNFSVGERIVVTWYNTSDESFFFTSRISFSDNNAPDPESPENKWYTMRNVDDYRVTYTEAPAHSTIKTVFNITDTGVHKTDGSWSLVNINLAIEWGSTYEKQFLVCEKIELLSDADIQPPETPTGLTATVLSDSKVQLFWAQPADNIGVVEYLIHMNGAIEGYTRSNNYTCVFLQADEEYTFSVSALDAAGNTSVQSDPIQVTTLAFQGNNSLINPQGFEYLGAILLPEDFSWGGEALAWQSSGGQSGSLFVTNVNQPENGLVGKVNIPSPVISTSKNITDLNEATTLLQPVDIRPTNVNNWDYVDIWRTGLEYIPNENRLYSSWSIHYTVTEDKHASISCCNADDLVNSTKHGAWYIGNAAQPPLDAMMSDWLFSIPQSWADEHCFGRNMVVGRCRDGGLSGLGPTLYAFAQIGAAPPSKNSELEFTTLLEYGPVAGTDNYNFPNAIDGYKHSDDWREALWLTAANQNAIAITGRKALGHNWYGYNGEYMQHDWVIADIPHPEDAFWETDPTGKGWKAHNYQPMIIFYDPADLARVGDGELNSYAPQPYAALRIPKNLFYSAFTEITAAAFDPDNRLLYIAELVSEADGVIILHAWKINPVMTSVGSGQLAAPKGFKLYQNYPNPFNPTTSIRYEVSTPGIVHLEINDRLGQHVKTLVSAKQSPGPYTIPWNGCNDKGSPVASGVYFCNLKTGDYAQTVKLLLVR